MTSLDEPAFHLAGARAVVTGAASGIGAACVDALRADGASVVGIDLHGDGEILAADVTREDQIVQAIAHATERLGGAPTIVVCAAGVYPVAGLSDMPTTDWDLTLATNLTGAMNCARHGTAAARQDGHGAVVVLVTSVGAVRSDWTEPTAAYCASKAALDSLVRSMAGEWAASGVRVNGVAPGLIDTPMLRTMDDPSAGTAKVKDRIPLGRVGTAAEVASVVCFLVSAEASYVTGTTIPVDGGYLVR